MLDKMLSTPTRYVVALPRNALIDEKARDLIARAQETQVQVAVVPIHSDQPRQKEQNILRRVEDALRLHSASQHAILLVSHETFSWLNVSLIEGWHVGIDENLDNAVAAGSFSATATWSALDRQYGLDPLADGQTWAVCPREGVARLKRGEFTKDVAAGPRGVSQVLQQSEQGRVPGHWRLGGCPQSRPEDSLVVNLVSAGTGEMRLGHFCGGKLF
jgi:hypothetical protein